MYDGDDVVLVFDNTGAWQHRFLHGNAVDQVFMQENVGEILWGLGDNQGTIRDVANYDPIQDESSVLNHREFDSFGNITAESNSSVNFRQAYTGRYFDEDPGIQKNGARWYDAQVSRWLSEDPITTRSGDTNFNRYVGNSPTNFIDPTGLVADYSPASFGLHGDGASWVTKYPKEYAIYMRALMDLMNHKMLVASNGASVYDGPGAPVSDDKIGGFVAENFVMKFISHEKLVEPGGWGSNTLIAGQLATEVTGVIDPTPLSDTLNAVFQLANGDKKGAGIAFAGAAVPGGFDKLKHLGKLPADKVLAASAKSADELAPVLKNQKVGLEFQQQVTKALDAKPAGAMAGTTLNGKKYTTIPDGTLESGALLEVKAGKYISNSKQLQAQASIGQAAGGLGNVLVVGPDAKVSKNVIKAIKHSTETPRVFRYDPAMEALSKY